MLKYFYNAQVLVVTGFIFLFFWLVSLIPFQGLDFLDPIGEALSDFQLTDMIYSKFPDNSDPDTNIVIVNIGQVSRPEMGKIIRHVNRYHPKVIGIDALFRKPKSLEIDTPFANALKEAGNVVMVSEVTGFDPNDGSYHEVKRSAPIFKQYVKNGFANIINDPNSPKTIRAEAPLVKVGDSIEYSFPVMLTKAYNPTAAQRCLDRGNSQELINWRGNWPKFFNVSTEDALADTVDLSLVRGKIVLLALLDLSGNRTLEDMYFTPLNKQYAGKTFPDMFGIVIHANMISMILSGNYVNQMSNGLGIVLAIVVCYLLMVTFSYINDRFPALFDISVKFSQLILSFLILLIVVLIFDKFRYIVQINLVLVVVLVGPDILELLAPVWERYEHRIMGLIRRKGHHPPQSTSN